MTGASERSARQIRTLGDEGDSERIATGGTFADVVAAPGKPRARSTLIEAITPRGPIKGERRDRTVVLDEEVLCQLARPPRGS